MSGVKRKQIEEELLRAKVDRHVEVDAVEFNLVCAETAEFDFEAIKKYVRDRYVDYDSHLKEIVNETVFRQIWPVIQRSQQTHLSDPITKRVQNDIYDFLRNTLYLNMGDYWVSSLLLSHQLGSPPVSIFDIRESSFNYRCFCKGSSLWTVDESKGNWLTHTFVEVKRAIVDPMDPTHRKLTVIPRLSSDGIKYDSDKHSGSSDTRRLDDLSWRVIEGYDEYAKHPTSGSKFPLSHYVRMNHPYDGFSPAWEWVCCRRCYQDILRHVVDQLNDQMWWRMQALAPSFLSYVLPLFPKPLIQIVLQHLALNIQ